jgi:serine/threonine protein kinase/Tol biopolymer transport system component
MASHWARLESLYHEVVALPPAARTSLLDGACRGDPGLRAEVEAMLAHENTGFLDQPAAMAGASDSGTCSPRLPSGSRLGIYEIGALLGIGGMGEVYRARDTKLNRDVAIKILLPAVANDPDRLARFSREARVLASLNHPNIAHIHGLEEADGVGALVLELVEGEDLAQRIARGPIRLDEALPIARQIADALEAAHEQGIIHRDLKPGNIKVRPDGTVKVLDFGLAKAMEPALGVGPRATEAMNSPALTSPATLTGVGVILGTAAYMSPEQARGRAVDRRSDIWAFGSVLFEMLTGERAFAGADTTDTIVSVVSKEPDWNALPSNAPAGIRRLLRRSLEKDPKRRLDSASAARIEIEEALTSSGAEADAHPQFQILNPAPAWRPALAGAVAAAVLSAGVVVVLWSPWRVTAPPRITRTTIATSSPATLTINGVDRDIAVSPDGTHLVYVGNNGTQIFLRALDVLDPVLLVTGGDGIRALFVSPDGQWVGFASSNTLRKVAITGGPPITITGLDSSSRGATWAADDTIIFATGSGTGLWRVSAAGGTPEVLTRPDRALGEAAHVFPEILPDGRAVLFTIASQTGGLNGAQVAVRDLRTGAQKVLLRGGSHAHYVSTGHLVYVSAGTLRAIAFDPIRLETRGAAVAVLSRLATTGDGAGDFTVSLDGTLAYVDAPGGLATDARTLVWVDRTGKEEAISAPPRAYEHPRLSPDGTRILLSSGGDLSIWDLRRATLTRLTLDPDHGSFPVWTTDGRHVVFSAKRNLWRQAADGSGNAERLTTSDDAQFPNGVTPDGAALTFHEITSTMGRDLFQVALDGTHRVTPLVQTKFDERNGIVSPDGRWLAYDSNSSGQFEIYVRPFPNVGSGQWQVSTTGGARPLWARSGKELFYADPEGSLLSVPVESNDALWHVGAPKKLLDGRYFTGGGTLSRTYDVSLDGQRFLMIKAPGTGPDATPPALIIVQHWDEELKRLVPTKH